jgi:hypothetical protein
MLKVLVGPLLIFLVLFANVSISSPYCTDDCDLSANTNFDLRGLQENQAAVNFTLLSIDGKTVKLSDLWSDKPLFLEFGAYT